MAFSLSTPQWLLLLTPYLAVIALIVGILALIVLVSLSTRLSRLTLGASGTVEESVGILTRDLKELQQFRSELERYLKLVEKRLQGSVSGVGVIRFNPFSGDGSGGNQSFATAFLDEKYNGVVFSSLYARDRMAMYGKPVTGGMSSFELTKEEQEAIEKAKQSIAHHTTDR